MVIVWFDDNAPSGISIDAPYIGEFLSSTTITPPDGPTIPIPLLESEKVELSLHEMVKKTQARLSKRKVRTEIMLLKIYKRKAKPLTTPLKANLV